MDSGRERFQLLLQQIGLTDDAFVSFFNGAEIPLLGQPCVFIFSLQLDIEVHEKLI